jgi:lipid A 3-O-deacylase
VAGLRFGIYWLAMLGWGAAVSPQALAQSYPLDGTTIAGTDENDAFNYLNKESERTDRYYTQGLRVAFTSPPVEDRSELDAGLFSWFAHNGILLRKPGMKDEARGVERPRRVLRVMHGFGQHMYTPENLTLTDPDPNDRPYGGWLYFSTGTMSYSQKELNSLEMQVGVVGPSARAGDAQDWYHEAILTIPKAQGWHNQLHDEPGINFNFERRWRPVSFPATRNYLDFTPGMTAAVGTVETSVGANGTLRAGWNLDGDFGPPRLRSGLASEFFYGDSGFYFFAGGGARLVVRDVFLDGSTWVDSPSVDKQWFVPEASAGFTGRLRFWDLFTLRGGYTYFWRDEEFRGQHGDSEFGAWSVGISFGDSRKLQRPAR